MNGGPNRFTRRHELMVSTHLYLYLYILSTLFARRIFPHILHTHAPRNARHGKSCELACECTPTKREFWIEVAPQFDPPPTRTPSCSFVFSNKINFFLHVSILFFSSVVRCTGQASGSGRRAVRERCQGAAQRAGRRSVGSAPRFGRGAGCAAQHGQRGGRYLEALAGRGRGGGATV